MDLQANTLDGHVLVVYVTTKTTICIIYYNYCHVIDNQWWADYRDYLHGLSHKVTLLII